MNRNASILLLSLLLISGCYTERISNQNLSYIYDRDASFLHPEFTVLHKNDSVAQLHFRINSNELLYLKNPVSNFFSAVFRLRYEVFSQIENRLLTDSSMVIIKDSSLVMQGKTLSGIIDLRPSHAEHAILKIELFDVRRTTGTKKFLEIDRSDPNCRQFFRLELADNGQLLSRNYLHENEVVRLSHVSGADSATVRYYHREFPLPKPPFSVESPKVFDYTADSIYQIDLNGPLSFKREGFYHIQIADSTKNGLTLFRFKGSFPQVKDLDGLMGPLRFLNSNAEYKKIAGSDYPKAAVDRFWLKLAGNPDRAKVLIQKFYSRVEDANLFFTSYLEGWKTDRGLIYLIFGPPNIIYKNSDSEHWIYGEENNPSSLGLIFYKVKNPFTDNDFRMDRSPIYKSSWYTAVDMWRQGRVYTDN